MAMRPSILLLSLGLWACGGSAQVAAPSPPPSVQAPAFTDGDVISYRIEDPKGRLVGRTHSRYSSQGQRLSVVTRVGLSPPIGPGEELSFDRSWEYASTLRSDLSPVSFKRLSSVDGRLELLFRNGSVSLIDDAATKEVPYQPDDSVVLPPDDLVLLSMALERSGLQPGSAGTLLVRAPETAVVSQWPVQVYADPERRTVFKLPIGVATLAASGRIASLAASDGRRFELESKASEAPPLLAPKVSAKYERPAQARFSDREVTLDVEGGQLAATFSLPKSRNRASPEGRLPAVVLFGDFPRGDRHGFTAQFDRGTWQILDRLADEGFVVLRVDARGADHSLESALADDQAMVRYLLGQAVVDPRRVHVLGHGFGALEALSVAGLAPVASVVALAPAYRPATLLTGRQDAPLAADYAKLDVAAVLKKVEVPVAIFQGLKDREVAWREDAQALVEAINKARRGQAKLYVYEYVDHLLKTQSSVSTPESYVDRGRPVDPKVLEDLIEWLGR